MNEGQPVGAALVAARENKNQLAGNTTAILKMICYVCGSENLSTEKCKVWCRDCHALIENCSGD